MTVPTGPVIPQEYAVLITSEHKNAERFTETVALSVQPYVDGQNVTLAMPAVYDLDTAVGVQLDAVGMWVGVSRNVLVPLANAYFSLDIAGLGLDEGYLMGPFDPSQGIVSLDDTTYRFVLRARIIANTWDGTVADAVVALQELFDTTTPGALPFIQDNFDMTMFFAVAGVLPPLVFLELMAKGYIPLKPAGVMANYYIPSVSGTPIFGLDVENDYVSGLDVGSLAQDLS